MSRVSRAAVAYFVILVLLGGGFAAGAWSSVGPGWALLMGATVVLEGGLVLLLGVAGVRREKRLRAREAATWDQHWGHVPDGGIHPRSPASRDF